MVVNIPDNQVPAGETLVEYIGSAPSRGSGFHRYVFLLFAQPGLSPMAFDQPKLTNQSLNGRAGFKIREFANKSGLMVECLL